MIVYDGFQATPLLSIGGIEIVAAPDVLGIIEVKDAENGSGDLASATGENGALGHTSKLAIFSPYAFRAIVLFRGKAPKPKKDSVKMSTCSKRMKRRTVAHASSPVVTPLGSQRRGSSCS